MSARTGLLLAAVLALSSSAGSAAPANDDPFSAEVVEGCSIELSGTTLDASNVVDALNCGNQSGDGSGVVQPFGGDVFYRVTVPWSFDLHVLVEPVGEWDPSLYIVTSPWNPDETCVAASDIAGNGIAEMVRIQNASISGEARDYIIGVDSWRADSAGEFILRLSCDIAVPVDDSGFSTLKSRYGGGR
jgi:hypothetical protein